MQLKPIPLSAQGFEQFGQVIELENAEQISINHGLTTRFHDLLHIDTNDQDGRPIVSLFRTAPIPLPHKVTMMERHPLGSQGFIPMGAQPFLVLVGKEIGQQNNLQFDDLALFITNGRQGINLNKNIWHHFQIVLDSTQDFIVIDRAGAGTNLEEIAVAGEIWIGDYSGDRQAV